MASASRPMRRCKKAAPYPLAPPTPTDAPATTRGAGKQEAQGEPRSPFWHWIRFAYRIPASPAAKEVFVQAMHGSTITNDTPTHGAALLVPLFFSVGNRVPMPLYCCTLERDPLTSGRAPDSDGADPSYNIVFPARALETHFTPGTLRCAHLRATLVAFYAALETDKLKTWFLRLSEPPFNLNSEQVLDLRSAFVWNLVANLVAPTVPDALYAPGQRGAMSPPLRLAQALHDALNSFVSALIDANVSHTFVDYFVAPHCPWKPKSRGEPLPLLCLFE